MKKVIVHCWHKQHERIATALCCYTTFHSSAMGEREGEILGGEKEGGRLGGERGGEEMVVFYEGKISLCYF